MLTGSAWNEFSANLIWFGIGSSCLLTFGQSEFLQHHGRFLCTWKTLKEISGVASLFKLQETLVVALAVLCYCDLPSVIRVSITDPEPWAHAACLTFAGNDQWPLLSRVRPSKWPLLSGASPSRWDLESYWRVFLSTLWVQQPAENGVIVGGWESLSSMPDAATDNSQGQKMTLCANLEPAC